MHVLVCGERVLKPLMNLNFDFHKGIEQLLYVSFFIPVTMPVTQIGAKKINNFCTASSSSFKSLYVLPYTVC